MNSPQPYELVVAAHYESLGYMVELTPHNDYGVDVFATKGEEKLAVQAKQYGHTSRKVNRKIVMELHGVKDYFDCSKGVIATDGVIIPNALEVADKLGIEILYLPFTKITAPSPSTPEPFNDIWNIHIKALEGKTLYRPDGSSNTIKKVDNSGLTRITKNGNKRRIDIEIFRDTVRHLYTRGSVTRDYINQEYDKRASSGIVLVLSQLPMFELTRNPIMTLTLKEHKD